MTQHQSYRMIEVCDCNNRLKLSKKYYKLDFIDVSSLYNDWYLEKDINLELKNICNLSNCNRIILYNKESRLCIVSQQSSINSNYTRILIEKALKKKIKYFQI
jgi:hypothetical protein